MEALIYTSRIVEGDLPFGDKLAGIVELTESQGYAADPVLLQAASGVGLRWLLRNQTEWHGHEATVAQVLSLHASNGGVMFSEMVETLDALDGELPDEDLDRLRDQISSAYALRVQTPCARCGDDPLGFVVDPNGFRESMRSRVEAEAERQRAALQVVARWAAED